uniref:Uncharacterized protein n=1 Tax=Triticum urartu TaxID=4572 RepID=A0A8R7UZK1_TRIUA
MNHFLQDLDCGVYFSAFSAAEIHYQVIVSTSGRLKACLLHLIKCLQGHFSETSITVLANHDIPCVHCWRTLCPRHFSVKVPHVLKIFRGACEFHSCVVRFCCVHVGESFPYPREKLQSNMAISLAALHDGIDKVWCIMQ